MADDERRAEIEAVEALAKYGQHRPGCVALKDRYAPCDCGFIAALDRVRDARGDDEGARLFAMRTSTDPAAQAEAHFRSSPDEDHEAGIKAAYKAADEHEFVRRETVRAIIAAYLSRVSPSRDGTADDGRSWRCTDCNCINREDEAFCFRCGAGQPEFPARVSPSRDGTVAVEDVAAWLDSEANRIAGNGELSDTVAGAIVGVRMRLLAEFSPVSTGDREENET